MCCWRRCCCWCCCRWCCWCCCWCWWCWCCCWCCCWCSRWCWCCCWEANVIKFVKMRNVFDRKTSKTRNVINLMEEPSFNPGGKNRFWDSLRSAGSDFQLSDCKLSELGFWIRVDSRLTIGPKAPISNLLWAKEKGSMFGTYFEQGLKLVLLSYFRFRCVRAFSSNHP